MFIRRIKFIIFRVREIIRDYFTGRKDFDSSFFLLNWESKFGKIHDPLPAEVKARISTLVPVGGGICELGAGYGRIAEQLQDSWNLILIEPEAKLYEILLNRFPHSRVIHGGCLSVEEIDATLFFSVRALEYSSLIEQIKMFMILKKSKNFMIVWERRYTVRKIEIAAFLAGYKNLYPQSIVN